MTKGCTDLVGFNATITELTRLGQIDILNNQDDFELYVFGRAVDEAYKKGGSPAAKSAANQVERQMAERYHHGAI